MSLKLKALYKGIKIMAQIKVQVLAVTPIERRTYNGRAWHQRQLQCFLEGKVAVHTLNAADGETPEAIEARNQLNKYDAGYYMADLVVQQGDRGKLEFSVSNFVRVGIKSA
jgi:hypothetical protein